MEEKDPRGIAPHREDIYKAGLITLFKGDSFFIFTYKKTEKILSALYLVTALFSDLEPMKWKIRGSAAETLSRVMAFYETGREIDLHAIQTGLIELISFLEISEKCSLVSSMNAAILKGECGKVLEAVKERGPKGSLMLPPEFFDTDIREEEIRKEMGRRETPELSMDKGQYKRHEMSFITNKDIGQNGQKNMKEKDMKLKDRKEAILDIIKKNKEVTIRDITALISDCSEKTIQRELLALVGSGVLKKTGERRWSRYQLV